MTGRQFLAALAIAVLFFPFPSAAALAADEDIARHASCKFCGMDRQKWNFSRVYLEYDNDTTEGTCSLHCAAVDLSVNLDKSPRTIWVADYDTKALIDAEKAAWVLGGKKPGVMTKRAKWAFADRAAADRFVAENEGIATTFDEAIRAAYQDMYEDTKMISERRAARRKAAAEQKAAEAPAAK